MDSVKAFARARVVELVFLLAASSALFSTVTFGFHVDDALRANVALIVGWSALVLVALASASYSPRSVAVGIPVIAVAGFGGMTAVSLAQGFGLFDDAYGNLGFFLLLGFLCALFTHLGTRRKGLALAYLVLGVMTCALVQFLYENSLVAQMLVYLLAGVALYVLAAQRAAVGSGGDAPQRLSVLGAGAVLCVVAAGLACAVFFAGIAPLNPPTHDLKLITKYYALEEVHVSGLQEIEHKQDADKRSDETDDGDDTTNRTDDESEEAQGDQSANDEVGANGEQDLGSQGIAITGFDEATGAVRYFITFPYWLLALLGAALLVALTIAAKRLVRWRRFERMRALPPREAVVVFYLFFEGRLARLGVKRPETLTPLEHARQNASQYAPFEEGAEGASYYHLAQGYCACVYGAGVPDERVPQECEQLYRVFYRNACRQVGKVRYFFTKFWLV